MRILLVEDSKTLTALMTSRLLSLGHEVTHASNGKEAIAAFREIVPDLVLMDIEMPVMNGFEATLHIRAEEATKEWAWTPIIFLTATDTEANLLSAIEAGGDDFIPKSVPEPVLFAKMLAMSRIAALRNSLSIANRKLKDLATLDQLTGLPNRRYLDLQLDEIWNQSTKSGTAVAVLMLDVDNFKKFNDRYGHQMGDDCLIKVAHAIDSVVASANQSGSGTHAFAARYGGEEFAVIIPDASIAMAKGCAQAILTAVQALKIPQEIDGDSGIVTISIGGKLAKPASEAISNTFRQADAALYESKEHGRNRVTFVEDVLL